MTPKLSRREALLRTAAIATAGAMPGTRFARADVAPRTLSRSGEIDAILQAAVDAAEVPGVVAMVANERSVSRLRAVLNSPAAVGYRVGVYINLLLAISADEEVSGYA